jgi:iron complex outermembrane receptor protein
MDEVERIEVIRGPGSAMYGANAYSGVVHVITRPPDTGPRATASIRGGQHGQTEVNINAGQKFGSLAIGVGAGMIQEDLWSSRDASGKEIYRCRLRGDLDLGPQTSFNFEGGALKASGLMHSAAGPLFLSDLQNFFGILRLEHQDLLVKAFYDHSNILAELDLALFIKSMNLVLARVPPIDGMVNRSGLLAQHSVDIFHNRLTYGGEYVFNHYTASALVDPHHYEHRASVFAQNEVDLDELFAGLPQLILTAGLRFDYNAIPRSGWESWELSPRAALVYTPTANHSLRLGYAHAFLKPNFIQSSLELEIEDVSDLGFDRLNMGNPDLQNQTIDSLELGYGGHFFDGRLTVRLDLSYSWYRNSILYRYDASKMEYKQVGPVLIPDINGPGFGFINIPEGNDGHNVDLQVIVRPTDSTRLFVNGGYRQVFDNETGRFYRIEPVWRLAAGADWKIPGGLTASLRGYFTSPTHRFVSNPDGILEPEIQVRIPATWLLNARVAYQLIAGPFDLSAGIEAFNLLNHRYRELGGLPVPNRPDLSAEHLGRKIVLFVQGEL